MAASPRLSLVWGSVGVPWVVAYLSLLRASWGGVHGRVPLEVPWGGPLGGCAAISLGDSPVGSNWVSPMFVSEDVP